MSVTHSLDTSTSRANPVPSPMKRLTVPKLKAMKGGEPIVMLTAYTARWAQLLDPHCDILLVGDSLGQVIYGLPSTVPVTLELMCAHGAAVVRGSWHAVVAVDMPFGAYEASPEQAFAGASRILKETGAAAVKLEGGEAMAPTVAFLTQRGIPVIGHVGLTPPAESRRRPRPMPARSEAVPSPAKSKSSAPRSEGFRCAPGVGREAPGAIAAVPSVHPRYRLSERRGMGEWGRPARIWRISLALRPTDHETFYREVDEELRRDQMRSWWERFGKLVIAGIVLFLALIGGFIWWQNQKEVKAGERSEKLIAAFDDISGRK